MTTHDSDARSGSIAALIAAAKKADWDQVVRNGGPPCFHLEPGETFCLRAEAWEGHGVLHQFMQLAALLSGSDQSDVMAECHKWSSWLVCVDTTTEYRICVRCQQKEFRPLADKPTKAAS